jgi:hypothetical protein
MGFFSSLDTAVAGHKAQKEASRFAATVKPNQTYYTVVVHQVAGGGTRELIHEHFVTGHSRITGQYMFGHRSAAALWLADGPVYSERPGGITIREYSDKQDAGPDIRGHISDY